LQQRQAVEVFLYPGGHLNFSWMHWSHANYA
jgi:hypothetical protein